jgi:hypothetical protein
MSDTFPIQNDLKKRNALSPFLSSFASNTPPERFKKTNMD